jgi:hypothetical protein
LQHCLGILSSLHFARRSASVPWFRRSWWVDVNLSTKITALLPPAASIRPANLPQHHNPGSSHLLIFKT